MWTPLPADLAAPERAAVHGEEAKQAFVEEDEGAAALSDMGSANSEEEGSEEDGSEEEEAGRWGIGRERGRGRSTNRAGGGIFGGADVDSRRRPWEEVPAPAAARSLSPGATRYRTRSRAATDGADLDEEGIRPFAIPIPDRPRRQGVAGWFGGVIGNAADGAAGGVSVVPSAESLVASILQASGARGWLFVSKVLRTPWYHSTSLCSVRGAW